MKRWVNVRGRETKKARVEIIPMIDAIFFLLVFFMYSSLSMVKMKGMGVSVPHLSKDQSVVKTKPPRRYIVTLDDSGKLFINLDPADMSTLTATLTSDLANDPDGTIVVNVAKRRTVQELVDLMDQVNQVKDAKGGRAAVIVATAPLSDKERADAAHGN